MEDVAIILLFSFGIVVLVGIFAIFCLCMYLREFPKIKHSAKADLENNTFETETEVDKSDSEEKHKKNNIDVDKNDEKIE